MKFSEAIREGSKQITPAADLVLSDDCTQGCALGMALVAAVGKETVPKPEEERYRLVRELWPWVGEYGVVEIGIHFDRSVAPPFTQAPTMTMDQFITWVEELEEEFGG